MSQLEPAQQTFTPQERRITMIGVLLVFLLSALDNTIVSTAMPRIAAHLQGLNLYAWVTTAYMLSSTVTVPIYGKLGDIYGRKPVLIVGMIIFLVGSGLCGLSGEFGPLPILGGGMTQLIVFRAIQGLGGGALFTTAFAIIADLYPPRERGKFAGLFGSVFGLASILGPVIGGFLTDFGNTTIFGLAVAGWRWIFYVNLPVSAVALFMIIAKMPQLTNRSPGKIDFLGAGLLVVAFVPLLLALSLGGHTYPWGSPPVLGLFAVAALGLIGFLAVEAKVENPILSLSLFRNRVFTTANAANIAINVAFMGGVTFLPLYMQLGQGVAATTSGLSMLPMMLGMIAASTVSGQAITKTGKYKPFMIFGAAMMTVALFLISRVTAHTTSLDLAWRMLLLGFGLGPSMSTFNIAIQNALPRNQVGVATSATQFFRQIGGTVGVAVFGAILTRNLAAYAPRLPATANSPAHVMDLSDLQRMAVGAAGDAAPVASASAPVVVDQAVRDVVVHAITGLFTVGMAIGVVALLLVLLIPVLPLENRRGPAPPPAGVEGAAEGLAEGEAKA
jgi:EmrB/QacA subfamily drug resistance transporter